MDIKKRMDIKKGVVLLLSLLCLPLQAITLEECQTLVQTNYPLIKQYGLIELATQYDVSNARKNYLPQISLLGQATWQNHVLSFPEAMNKMYQQLGLEVKGINQKQYRVGVHVNQIIWDGGATKSAVQINKMKSAVEQSQNAVDLFAVRQRVNDIYFGILLLQSNIELNQELLAVLESNYQVVEARVRNGVAMESDADAVKVEILSARQQRTSMDAVLTSYKQMLSLLADKDLSEATFDCPDAPDIQASDASARPEMALFNAQEGLENVKYKTLQSSLMPQIAAFAQAYYQNPGFNSFNALFDNGNAFDLLMGVRLKWNIDAFYRNKKSRYRIAVDKQSIEVARKTFLLNTGIQSVMQDGVIKSKREALQRDKEIVDLRASIRQAGEAKLANGVILVNDLLRDIMAENNARIQMQAHEIELLQGLYNEKQITNQ